jgi:hypothetical protein
MAAGGRGRRSGGGSARFANVLKSPLISRGVYKTVCQSIGTCAFMPRGVPHAWKNTGAETGRVLFLYTPAGAGGFFEEQLGRPAGSIVGAEANEIRRRHGWEIVGPPPF